MAEPFNVRSNRTITTKTKISMENNGWVKLHRKFLEWEWYTDIVTKTVFLHLLLTANHEQKRWMGKVIERGQKIVTREGLAAQLGLSVQQVRTAWEKLERTGEITRKSTNEYTLITICKYEDYQQNESNDQPTNNQRITNDQPTNNHKQEYKNERNKEYKNNIDNSSSCYLPNSKPTSGKQQQQPTIQEVIKECKVKGYAVDAVQFFAYYEANGWLLKGNRPMRNWRAALYAWQKNALKEPGTQTEKASAEVHDVTNEHLKRYDPSPKAISYDEYQKIIKS